MPIVDIIGTSNISSGSSENSKFNTQDGKKIYLPKLKFEDGTVLEFQGHHVLPKEFAGGNKYPDFFKTLYDLELFDVKDWSQNGFALPDGKGALMGLVEHRGGHAHYSAFFDDILGKMTDAYASRTFADWPAERAFLEQQAKSLDGLVAHFRSEFVNPDTDFELYNKKKFYQDLAADFDAETLTFAPGSQIARNPYFSNPSSYTEDFFSTWGEAIDYTKIRTGDKVRVDNIEAMRIRWDTIERVSHIVNFGQDIPDAPETLSPATIARLHDLGETTDGVKPGNIRTVSTIIDGVKKFGGPAGDAFEAGAGLYKAAQLSQEGNHDEARKVLGETTGSIAGGAGGAFAAATITGMILAGTGVGAPVGAALIIGASLLGGYVGSKAGESAGALAMDQLNDRLAQGGEITDADLLAIFDETITVPEVTTPSEPLPSSRVYNGSDDNEWLIGLNGGDLANAKGGHDSISLSGGGNTVEGGAGYDTVFYSGFSFQYAVSEQPDAQGYWTVESYNPDDIGSDKLRDVEAIQFRDVRMRLVSEPEPEPEPEPQPEPEPEPEPEPLPFITVDDAEVDEGGTLRFRVHLNGEVASEAVTFYATTYLRQTGGDYSGFINKSFTILAGQRELFVEVDTIQDQIPEGNEVMSLRIHDVTGANEPHGVSAWADGWITDDEVAVENLAFEGQSVLGTVTGGDSQLYKFVTDGDGVIRIDLSRMTSDANLEILNYRFEPVGTQGISSNNLGIENERVEFPFLPNQLYYIKITSEGGTTPFTLSFLPEFGTNRLPTAVDETLGLSVRADGTVLVPKSLLLANDSDPDGDQLSITHIDGDGVGPSWVGNGTAVDQGDAIVFTPDGTSSTGRFAYAVSDGKSIHRDWALATLSLESTQGGGATGVDLVIDNILVNGTPSQEWFSNSRAISPDGPFEITYDVINVGTQATPDIFTVGIGASPGITGVGSFSGVLGAGESRTFTFSPRIDEGANGLVGFSPYADWHGTETGDTNPDNNKRQLSGFIEEIYPQADIDLTIENVLINETPYEDWIRAGRAVTPETGVLVTYDVVNYGSEATPEGRGMDTYVSLPSESEWLGTFTGQLEAGSRRTISLDPDISDFEAGLHGLQIGVNRSWYGQLIPETDISNNYFDGVLQVIDTPAVGTNNESFGLTWPTNSIALTQNEAGGRWVLGVARLGEGSDRSAVATIGYSGTADHGEDFSGITELAIGANEGHQADGHGFILSIFDDRLDEADLETIEVRLIQVYYQDTREIASIHSDYNAVTLNIRDDDTTGVQETSNTEVLIKSIGATEARDIQFEFSLADSANKAVTVYFNIEGGTATEGADFENVARQQSITLTNEAPKKVVSFTTFPDGLVENNETVRLIVLDVTGGQTKHTQYHATIIDDQPAPFINEVTGTGAGETLDGTAGKDRIVGYGGDDRLVGGGGKDELIGNSGDDTLEGGAGADILNGGGGYDEARYTDAGTGVVADLQDASANTGIAKGDTYAGIERLYGSEHADGLRGDGGENVLRGHDGHDVLHGRGGTDALYGMNGKDQLYGGGDKDFLYGGADDDRLYGSTGNDELYGGGGGDMLQGGAGKDTLNGGTGTDTARYGGARSEYVFTENPDGTYAATGGPDGGDTLKNVERVQFSDGTFDIADLIALPNLYITGGYAPGGWFFQGIVDNASVNWINKGDSPHNFGAYDAAVGATTEATSINGYLSIDDSLDENDIFLGSIEVPALIWNEKSSGGISFNIPAGAEAGIYNLIWHIDPDDLITETNEIDNIEVVENFRLFPAGTVPVYGNNSDEQIVGTSQDDWIFAHDGDDEVLGNAGDDWLIGGDDDDFLSGGIGDDRIKGDSGNNILIGGLGSDVFVFDFAQGQDDTIRDFEDGVDKIEFRWLNIDDLSILNVQGSAVITFGESDYYGESTITLEGIQKAQLSVDDFIFLS